MAERPSPTEVIDHKARGEAALAHQRVDDHEKACAERWRETCKAIEGLRQAVIDVREVFERRWVRLMTMLVGTLLSAVAALLAVLYDLLR